MKRTPCPLHRATGLLVYSHAHGDFGLAPRCNQPVAEEINGVVAALLDLPTSTRHCALQAGHPGECE